MREVMRLLVCYLLNKNVVGAHSFHPKTPQCISLNNYYNNRSHRSKYAFTATALLYGLCLNANARDDSLAFIRYHEVSKLCIALLSMQRPLFNRDLYLLTYLKAIKYHKKLKKSTSNLQWLFKMRTY